MRKTINIKAVLSLAHTHTPLQGKWGPSYPNRLLLDKKDDAEQYQEIKKAVVALLKANPPTKEKQGIYKRQKLSPKAILKDRFLSVKEKSLKDGDSFDEDHKNYHEMNLGKILVETTSKTPPVCIGKVGKKLDVINPQMVGSGDKVVANVQLFCPKQTGSVSFKLISLTLISKWKPEEVDSSQVLAKVAKTDVLKEIEDSVEAGGVEEDDLEDATASGKDEDEDLEDEVLGEDDDLEEDEGEPVGDGYEEVEDDSAEEPEEEEAVSEDDDDDLEDLDDDLDEEKPKKVKKKAKPVKAKKPAKPKKSAKKASKKFEVPNF